MGPVATFASLIDAEAAGRGSGRARQVIVLGDGATWIWNLAADHFPGATHIVDRYHAREHLHDLGAIVAPDLGQDAPAWLAERLAELKTEVTSAHWRPRRVSCASATAAKHEKDLRQALVELFTTGPWLPADAQPG